MWKGTHQDAFINIHHSLLIMSGGRPANGKLYFRCCVSKVTIINKSCTIGAKLIPSLFACKYYRLDLAHVEDTVRV